MSRVFIVMICIFFNLQCSLEMLCALPSNVLLCPVLIKKLLQDHVARDAEKVIFFTHTLSCNQAIKIVDLVIHHRQSN